MNLQQGSFDTVDAIRHLAGQLSDLAGRVAALESRQPYATMDAAGQGTGLFPYLGPAISQKMHEALWVAGLDTMEKLHAATDDELLAIAGVGRGTLRLIREALS